MDLTGKNVLISGGTRGIGSSIVDTFNEAGADLDFRIEGNIKIWEC